MPDELRSRRGAAIEYVFLDRDGVINRKLPEGQYVTRWEDFEMLPGVAAAIATLNRSGRKVIVATNQRGIALGLMTEADLSLIHERLRGELGRQGAILDAIYYCPHGREECNCRKPQTGMIESAFQDFPGATPENSVFIGDSLADMECGNRAGMATIFVENEEVISEEDQGEERRSSERTAKQMAGAMARSLSDAVHILQQGALGQ
jgi:D-glycero-D-manno-heptose 1,7-bisphosphate phosphatase